MIQRLTFSAALTLVCVGAVSWAPALHRLGPPPGHTGGFGEPTCAICHIGDDVNAFGGSTRLEGLPPAWEPGAFYVLRVVLEADETVLAGFQLAARHGDGMLLGEPAGTLSPTDGRVVVTETGTGHSYAHHSPEGTSVVSAEGSDWFVEWTAPLDGESVTFNLAANSGNGDDSPLLDLVYVYEVTIPAAAPSRPDGPLRK